MFVFVEFSFKVLRYCLLLRYDSRKHLTLYIIFPRQLLGCRLVGGQRGTGATLERAPL